MRNKIDEEDLLTIKTLYDSGLSIVEIANMFDVTRTTIYYWLKREDYGINNSIKKRGCDYLSISDKNRLYKDYLAGKSVEDLSKEYNTSMETIVQTIKFKSNHTEFISNLDNEILEGIKEDYKNNLAIAKIAKKYKLAYGTIHKIIQYNNLENTRGVVLKADYFKNLDDKKAYNMGLIFSMSCISKHAYRKHCVCFSLTKEMIPVVRELLDELTSVGTINIHKCHDNNFIAKFNSKEILDDLISYGMEGDINIPEKYLHSFFKGYFMYSLRIVRPGIRILFKDQNYLNGILNYFDKLEIIHSTITKNSVLVINKKSIESLLREHPELIDRALNSNYREYYEKLNI
ncbi:ATPase subunit of terminase family protein (plasmid) [Clostridium baratii str. Sullivan]|uniref:ATPase subunit of terminase family protein n=1 Tax=Clostridium baratii str. Sullivan TaxID=1415775 RepID=A0A0A7G2R5_9CLOT|nr:helix-turn-helix domain-containing protein [Clostridium baratii]AIY85300.1 ATPase subunit of terminase family protein [Clostridium baratii str. Sullivan]